MSDFKRNIVYLFQFTGFHIFFESLSLADVYFASAFSKLDV